MGEPVAEVNVFKFVSLRPPNTPDPDRMSRLFITDTRELDQTVLNLLSDRSGGAARTLRFANDMVSALHFSPNDPVQDDRDLMRLWRFLRTVQLSGQKGLSGLIQCVFGQTPAHLLQGFNAKRLSATLWDRLYVCYILNRARPLNLGDLLGGLRTLRVLELLESEEINERESLDHLLSATVLIPAQFADFLKPDDPSPAAQVTSLAIHRNKGSMYLGLIQNFVDTHVALNHVISLPTATTVVRDTRTLNGTDGHGDLVARTVDVNSSRVQVDKTARERLPDCVKAVLQSAGSGTDSLNIPATVDALHTRLSVLYQQISSIRDPAFGEFIGATALSLPGMSSVLARLAQTRSPDGAVAPFPPRRLVRPLGIGDLKVVKQKLTKYAAGEVAHIENVLQGESKTRKFRTLDRSEQTISSSIQTTESVQKDTQTTDRFELKKETEKTIQENMSVQAGVTVSASYGPVQLGAHADFAYSTSNSDTVKTSSNFAREVVDRSVSRIEKSVKEERTTKSLHEVEEINDHGLVNVPGTGNVTGVYRWVDKHYTAQIYNYGVRLMFEFILPEPAAFYIYSQNHNRSNDAQVVPPSPLTYGSHVATHRDITESTYQDFVARYRVQGVVPPPPMFKTVSAAFEVGEIDSSKSIAKSSKELVVPDGYEVVSVHYSGSIVYTKGANQGAPKFDMLLGDVVRTFINEPGGFRESLNLLEGPSQTVFGPSIVPFAITGYDINAYAVTAEIHCRRRAGLFEAWQLLTFDKITAAYEVLQADYERRLAAATVQRGVIIQGHNPGINRQVEQTELKKLCITMLTDEYYKRFQAMREVADTPPEVDIAEAIEDGKFIQFFEQAFEWSQMTYLFYPYFWGRKANWIEISNTYDDDPLFTQFLQAGAARVVVPVPLSYKDAVLSYVEDPSRPIWSGGDVPHIDDPLYLSLAEELRDKTDDLQHATPEGPAWEIVLPTTLVWLQPGSGLPTFS